MISISQSPTPDTVTLSSYNHVPRPYVLVSTRSLLLGETDLPRRSVPMNSPVMETPSQRAASRKAEQDSGLSDLKAEAEIDIEYLESVTCGKCSACGVYVGPDHYEKSYYFHYVRKQWVWNFDDTRSYIDEEGYLALLCGGCAQGLPDSQRLLDRVHCDTTYLLQYALPTEQSRRYDRLMKDILSPDTYESIMKHADKQTFHYREMVDPWEKQQVAAAAREYMLEQFRWYLLLTMICHKINYRFLFYSRAQSKLEEARISAAAKAKAESRRRKRIEQALRKQEHQDRSLLEPVMLPTMFPIPTPQPHVMSMRATDLFEKRCSISSAFPV